MSAIIHKWLRIKGGRAFHARIGVRKAFACGKQYVKWFDIPESFNPVGQRISRQHRCKVCRASMAMLEDMYGETD